MKIRTMKEMDNLQNALRIRNLSKTYANGVPALNDISLTIPQGMYGLLGPNGAGKSTLMRTSATLQEPNQGSITLAIWTFCWRKTCYVERWATCHRSSGYIPVPGHMICWIILPF
ncbi:ATP-binding cassette domain-containing protein [Mucilaginibacter sp. HD30]